MKNWSSSIASRILTRILVGFTLVYFLEDNHIILRMCCYAVLYVDIWNICCFTRLKVIEWMKNAMKLPFQPRQMLQRNNEKIGVLLVSY